MDTPDTALTAASDRITGNVSLMQLFIGFSEIGLSGFGGVAAWAHRALVERRRWLSDQEYAELTGISQVLPGPNIVNFSILFGDRCQGAPGAVAAFGGLMVGPLCILVGLALLYDQFGHLPLVQAGLGGVTAAGGALVIGTALRMARRLKPGLAAILIGLAAFLAAGILHWPLVWIVLGLAPVSLVLTFRETRR